jgi:hypothetical protein
MSKACVLTVFLIFELEIKKADFPLLQKVATAASIPLSVELVVSSSPVAPTQAALRAAQQYSRS